MNVVCQAAHNSCYPSLSCVSFLLFTHNKLSLAQSMCRGHSCLHSCLPLSVLEYFDIVRPFLYLPPINTNILFLPEYLTPDSTFSQKECNTNFSRNKITLLTFSSYSGRYANFLVICSHENFPQEQQPVYKKKGQDNRQPTPECRLWQLSIPWLGGL